jgi:hypothetical protein
MKEPKTKGQVSIFMIVALVIVIGGGMFFYFTKVSTSSQNEEELESMEQVPLQFDPVQYYITGCISSTAETGLRIIGKQGGYISFTNRTLNKESIVVKNEPTESDAVSFTRNSDLKIPYWYYLKSQNGCSGDCQFASKRPDLRDSENSIEKQLERYIDLEFKSCINGFEDLETQGYSIDENSALKSDVTITEEDVIVSAEYSISARSLDASQEMERFYTVIPLNLARTYELATTITNMQSEFNFLERHALNLLVAFSGVDTKKLPPMSDMKFGFGAKETWQKTDIKNKITGLLTSYVPAFQVDGTYNYDRTLFSSQMKQRLYDSTIIPVADEKYSSIAAEFTYLDFWPAYFNMNCKGELCRPTSANSFIAIFGIQDYRFSYDISFPVLVELTDMDAFGGDGYSFNFFLEGNIRDNKEMKSDFSHLEASSDSQLCEVTSSAETKVNVVDSITKQNIDDAKVLYAVLGESCFIAASENGVALGKIPIALGGVINVVKDGYIGKYVEYDAKLNSGDELTVELTPVKTRKIIVRKKNVQKTIYGWQFIDQELDLGSKDIATVSIERINSPKEMEFSSVAEYRPGQDAQLEIAPGEYRLDIMLISNERIVIPAKRECVKILGGLFGEECYDIPRIDLSEGIPDDQAQFIAGGFRANITVSSLDFDKETIIFNALNIDLASVPEPSRVVEDLNQIGEIEAYSEQNKIALWPRFE